MNSGKEELDKSADELYNMARGSPGKVVNYFNRTISEQQNKKAVPVLCEIFESLSPNERHALVPVLVDAADLDPESVVSITDSVIETLEKGESTGTDADLQVLRAALNTLERVSRTDPAALISHQDLLFELIGSLGDVRNIKSLIVILTNATIATPPEERDIHRITNTINELATADENRIPTQPTGNSNKNSESSEWKMSAAEQAQFIALREGRRLTVADSNAAERLLPTFIDKLYDETLTVSEQAAFGCLAILDEHPKIVQNHSEHGVSEMLTRLRQYHRYNEKISDVKTQTQVVTEELTKRGAIDTPGSEQESDF